MLRVELSPLPPPGSGCLVLSHFPLGHPKANSSSASCRLPSLTVCSFACFWPLVDHQSLPASRCHRDGSGAEPGRGHRPADQRGPCTTDQQCKFSVEKRSLNNRVFALAGKLCLPGVAELPGEDCGIPTEEPLLGSSETRLGLHLQMDQRLLHRSDWSCLLPQVAAKPEERGNNSCASIVFMSRNCLNTAVHSCSSYRPSSATRTASPLCCGSVRRCQSHI